MSAKAICAACDEVVLPEVEVMKGWQLAYTWTGRRAKWSHRDWGVVHICAPAARALVFARDGRRCGNPPWLRVLWRRRWTQPIARLMPQYEFTTLLTLEPVEGDA